MGGTLAVSYLGLSPRSRLGTAEARVLLGVLLGFAAMTFAGFLAAFAQDAPWSSLAFGMVVSAVMAAEFLFLMREGLLASAAPVPRAGASGTSAGAVTVAGAIGNDA
jgi:hypothetical protein